MNESGVYFVPNVFWRIKDVTGLCKRKGPFFKCFGATWKLKFVYAESPAGNKSSITLKISEGLDRNISIKSTTHLVPGLYCNYQIQFTASSDMEWIIWEQSDNSIAKIFTPRFHTIIEVLKTQSFQCCFSLQPNWHQISDSIGKELQGGKSVDFPLCVTCLLHDFGSLFNSHVMSDVILECGDQKIYAHTAVLTARSQVFAAMFRLDMKESKEPSVVIEDVEPKVLEQLVRYMYSGEIQDMGADLVCKLYAAADRYGVNALKMKCGVLMVKNSEGENSSSTAADGVVDVEENILTHFANIKAVLGSGEWKKLSEKEPKFAHKAFQFFVSEGPS